MKKTNKIYISSVNDKLGESYLLAKQNATINNICTMNVDINKNTGINKANGNIEIDALTNSVAVKKNDNFIMFFDFGNEENQNMIIKFATSTAQLLLFTFNKYAMNSKREISFSLDEYMENRGLSDKKEARKQIKRDLNTLYNASITCKEKMNGKMENFQCVRLVDFIAIKNGIIKINIANTFLDFIHKSNTNAMPFHKSILKISGKNKDVFNLSYYITQQAYLKNAGENRNFRLSVGNLLKECPALPSYKEVMEKSKHVKKLIIRPFIKNLDMLEELKICSYHFCKAKGSELSQEEIENIDNISWGDFSKLYVEFTMFNDYPKLERKQIARKNKGSKENNTNK